MKKSTLIPLSIALAISAAPFAPALGAESLPPAFSAIQANRDFNLQRAAMAQLTTGVREVAAPGLTGAVATFGGNAFPVVAGRTGKTALRPVAAAAISGNTRVIAFGHDGYLGGENLAKADTGRLMDNALTWVSGGTKPAKVGVIVDRMDTVEALKARGFNALVVTSKSLEGINTLVVNGHSLKSADLGPLQEFLARGGGLIIATTGWGWNWEKPATELANDFVGNKLLAPYGLIWTTGTVTKTTDQGLKVEPLSPLVDAGTALTTVESRSKITKDEEVQAVSAVSDLLSGLPDNDTQILPRIRQITGGSMGEVVPFERNPLGENRGMERLVLTLQAGLEKRLPVSEIKPSPAGAIFPGDVPPNYKPVTKTVAVDTKVPDWHSLGLYAAPGSVITVKLPDGVSPEGLSVRIGCHTDKLWHLDSWKRAPEISRITSLTKGETKFANPYGGLVYIVVDGKTPAPKFDVTVTGAYEAPLYVKGQTNLADWKNTIRWAPGPWAEIACDKIILTVPSRSVRDLNDPAALCDFYDKGMDAAADLYAIPRDRKRPERIVADVQISAGYMHSGYPIMTWLDVEKTTVDLERLTKFPWGHFHELGHNHQQSDWTFAGTGEVTNNLLPLYVMNQVLGRPMETGHPAIAPENFAKMWTKYEANGRQFKDWQSEPFLALNMYMQMQRAFGWDPFKKVFAEYRTLTETQRPKTEEQKHDQWMVRMSKATGRNLGPFFEKWGVPTSTAARDSIKNLPAWMPDFPTAANTA